MKKPSWMVAVLRTCPRHGPGPAHLSARLRFYRLPSRREGAARKNGLTHGSPHPGIVDQVPGAPPEGACSEAALRKSASPPRPRPALHLRRLGSDVGWGIALRGSLRSHPERFAKRTFFQRMKQRPHERSEQGSGNPRRVGAPARGADGPRWARAPPGADGQLSAFAHRWGKRSCKAKRVTLS